MASQFQRPSNTALRRVASVELSPAVHGREQEFPETARRVATIEWFGIWRRYATQELTGPLIPAVNVRAKFSLTLRVEDLLYYCSFSPRTCPLQRA